MMTDRAEIHRLRRMFADLVKLKAQRDRFIADFNRVEELLAALLYNKALPLDDGRIVVVDRPFETNHLHHQLVEVRRSRLAYYKSKKARVLNLI